jgi:hypothetical protein
LSKTRRGVKIQMQTMGLQRLCCPTIVNINNEESHPHTRWPQNKPNLRVQAGVGRTQTAATTRWMGHLPYVCHGGAESWCQCNSRVIFQSHLEPMLHESKHTCHPRATWQCLDNVGSCQGRSQWSED